ncbi:hypothetical protein BHM03_00039301 [Ensete ventricosum]|nr:hypothetical protein BHM03_00039301 [Ensete ventricosum]
MSVGIWIFNLGWSLLGSQRPGVSRVIFQLVSGLVILHTGIFGNGRVSPMLKLVENEELSSFLSEEETRVKERVRELVCPPHLLPKWAFYTCGRGACSYAWPYPCRPSGTAELYGGRAGAALKRTPKNPRRRGVRATRVITLFALVASARAPHAPHPLLPHSFLNDDTICSEHWGPVGDPVANFHVCKRSQKTPLALRLDVAPPNEDLISFRLGRRRPPSDGRPFDRKTCRKEDMCSGHRKLSPPPLPPTGAVAPASGEAKQPSSETAALLLEIAASDDLAAFKRAVEDEGHPFDVAAHWYGRSPSRGMGYQQRTPLMIAALYGSTGVMGYLLSARPAEAARRAASDGATALHCAAAGGSPASLEAVKLLIGADAGVVDALDASGNRPGDVVARQSLSTVAKSLGVILKAPSFPGLSSPGKEEQPKQGEKKEYPPDSTLPDINTGIYGTDEFRMYTFKIKPCSRAYSHDWTECPFVHPGENARRRDPRKFSYSCVPCLEFRKGSCRNGDACEYAHGVFESWLHPAQYRTRLCKDETGCNRRVCFFAHKPEELRTVNPSAASVAGTLLSSPRSSSPAFSSLDMAMALTLMQQPGSPMSPTASSGLGAAAAWMNQAGGLMTPPALQLPSSRLNASLRARELDFDLELLGLEGYQQKLVDGITRTASPRANRGANALVAAAAAARAPEYTDLLGSMDPSLLTQLQGLSMRKTGGAHFLSPSGIQMHQPQLLSGYGGSQCSSPPVSSTSSFGLDHSMAKAIMNSRASAFAMRSQSFCDRGATAGRQSMLSAMTTATPSQLSDWGSPGGKLDWGIQGDELNKLRKSTSFALRSNHATFGGTVASGPNEPDASWVQSLVKDGLVAGEHQNADMFSPWAEENIMA